MVLADEEGWCSHKRSSRAAGRRNFLYTCAETSTRERKFKTGANKLKVERKMNITVPRPAPSQADIKSFLFHWQLSSSPLHSLSVFSKNTFQLWLFSAFFSLKQKIQQPSVKTISQSGSNRQSSVRKLCYQDILHSDKVTQT